MSPVIRAVLAAAALAALTGCGTPDPLGRKPGGGGSDGTGGTPVDLPVVGGAKASAVSFGPEGPKVPSLFKAPDGTWGVAYGSDRLGNKHIFFASSKDGRTWSPPAQVQPGGLSDQEPALFADQAGFHVVFASNREVATWALYVSDLTAGGWSPPVRLNLPGSLPTEPSIARTSHGWALAYRSTDGVVVAESADGHYWYEARVAGTHLGDPAIAQIGDRLTVVAHRSAELYEISRGRQGPWTPARPLNLGGLARQPSLAVDETGNLALACSYKTDAADEAPVHIALSTRRDGKWTPPETLTGGTYDNMNPTLQITPDGGRSLAWGIFRSASERGILFASLGASRTGTGTAAAWGGFATTRGGSRY